MRLPNNYAIMVDIEENYLPPFCIQEHPRPRQKQV